MENMKEERKIEGWKLICNLNFKHVIVSHKITIKTPVSGLWGGCWDNIDSHYDTLEGMNTNLMEIPPCLGECSNHYHSPEEIGALY